MRLTQAQVQLRLRMFLDACSDFERDLPQVWRQLRDGQLGYPASTLGGGPPAGDVSDPTGRAAMQPDPAAAALSWVSELACYLEATARELDRVRREWRPYVEPPRPCSNPWCPDRAVAAERRARCHKCDRHKRDQGVERGSPQDEACARARGDRRAG